MKQTISQVLMIGIFALGSVLILGGSTPSYAQGVTAEEVLARINEYRITHTIPPLIFNETLTQMAIDQANFVVPFDPLPEGGKIHIDGNGLFPRDRAFSQYGWVTYGTGAQIVVGENTAVSGLDYAMNFWENSRIHNEAMSNPSYREVGIGVLPHQYGSLIVVVFGGRPNMLPALVSPDGTELYLTTDEYGNGNVERVQHPTEYQILDSGNNPLYDEWQAWRPHVPIPAGAGNSFTVVYRDANGREATWPVNRTSDFVTLPETVGVTEIPFTEAPVDDETVQEIAAASVFHPQVYALDLNPVARDVMARINEYRINQLVPPLVPNPTLTVMAQDQADYVIQFNPLPEGGKIHIDEGGLFPRERATQSQYNWVTYGTLEQILVGENTSAASVSYAMDFWANSEIHQRAMSNPSYREVGIGVREHEYGYLVVVVFGGRPNEMTAQVSPDGTQLYLSNDYFEEGHIDHIANVNSVQLLDPDGNPYFENPLAWHPTINLPDNIASQFTVVYSDGIHEVQVPVDMAFDYVLVRDTLDRVPDETTVVQAESNTEATTSADTGSTEAPSTTPETTSEQNNTAETTTTDTTTGEGNNTAASPDAMPTVPPVTPAAVLQPNTVATQQSQQQASAGDTTGATTDATPVPPPSGVVLRLIYDETSISIINVSGQAIDVSDVIFLTNDGISLDMAFMLGFSGVFPGNYPPDGCLHVWTWQQVEELPPHPSCTRRVGVFTTDPYNEFWTREDGFMIDWGEGRASCAGGSAVCDISFN